MVYSADCPQIVPCAAHKKGLSSDPCPCKPRFKLNATLRFVRVSCEPPHSTRTGYMVARALGAAPTIADSIIDQLAAPTDRASSADAGPVRAPLQRLLSGLGFGFG